MIIQEKLYMRLKAAIEVKNKQIKHKNIELRIRQAKTGSIYITAFSLNDDQLEYTIRISDHYNTTAKTKVLAKNTKFKTLTNKINELVNDLERKRFQLLLNEL